MKHSEIKPIPIWSMMPAHRIEIPGIISAVAIIGAGYYLGDTYRWPTCLVAVLVYFLVNEGWSRWRLTKHTTSPQEPPPPPQEFEIAPRVEFWRKYFARSGDGWIVLFAYDTCVVLSQCDDPVEEARAILRDFGPSSAGTPSADMSLFPVAGDEFVVGCHDARVFTYVRALIVGEHEQALVALAGRIGRDFDVATLLVVHHCRLNDS